MQLRRHRERGGILSALLITGVVVICVAVIAVMFVVRNVRISTTAHRDGDDVSIDTPAGHLTVRDHERGGWPSSDIPRYPGAYVSKGDGGGAEVQWNSSRGDRDRGFSVSALELITQDPARKVFDYYRNQLPSWVVAEDHDGEMRLELKQGGYKRIVGIHEQNDGTHIGVASVGEPASN
jgi:hypothetical protein